MENTTCTYDWERPLYGVEKHWIYSNGTADRIADPDYNEYETLEAARKFYNECDPEKLTRCERMTMGNRTPKPEGMTVELWERIDSHWKLIEFKYYHADVTVFSF